MQKLYYACKIAENYRDCKIPVIQRLYDAAQQIVERLDTPEQEQMLIRLHVTRFQMIQNGPFVPQYNYGPAGDAGEHSDLEISARRLNETIDTAHGGFLHELTHAAVQRTFHNTPLHLGFRAIPLISDNRAQIQRQFEQVLEYRSQTARHLNQLIHDESANAQSPFTKWQLHELTKKLDYGACQAKHANYIESLRQFNESHAEASLSREDGQLLLDIIESLVNPPQQQPQQDNFKIDGTIFMEYDTTINQMLLWCYDWEIPRDNPVYRGLADAAQVEVDRRTRELTDAAQVIF